MEELVFQSIPFLKPFIDFEVSVFAVSDNRMSDSSKVDS